MQVDLKKISTESRNKNTMNIDQMSTIEMLKAINNEDKTVAFAVEKALGQIALLVDDVEKNQAKAMELVKGLTDKYPLYE